MCIQRTGKNHRRRKEGRSAGVVVLRCSCRGGWGFGGSRLREVVAKDHWGCLERTQALRHEEVGDSSAITSAAFCMSRAALSLAAGAGLTKSVTSTS